MEVYVNEIREDNGTIRGIAIDDDLVRAILTGIYDVPKVNQLIMIINNNKAMPVYFFERFHQFVAYFQYDIAYGWSIELMDFQDNDDTALDRYLAMRNNDWRLKDTKRVMELHQEIMAANPEKAVMLVKNPVL